MYNLLFYTMILINVFISFFFIRSIFSAINPWKICQLATSCKGNNKKLLGGMYNLFRKVFRSENNDVVE